MIKKVDLTFEKNLLSNLARHILVVSHFFILVAEFFLNFFEAHLHLLEFSLVLNLHFSLGFVYFDTVCETLFKEVKLRADFSKVIL